VFSFSQKKFLGFVLDGKTMLKMTSGLTGFLTLFSIRNGTRGMRACRDLLVSRLDVTVKKAAERCREKNTQANPGGDKQ